MRLPTAVRGYLVTALAGLAFGAADQYVNSIHVSRYIAASVTISLLSAPWLLLPFAAGATQRGAGRAARLGLTVTLCALAGWIVMILSPVEGAHITAGGLLSTTASQGLWFAGAAVAGPLYGWLGHRWHVRRARLSALLAAAPLLLEPLAGLTHVWLAWGDPVAFLAELAAAVLLVGYFVFTSRRRRPPVPG